MSRIKYIGFYDNRSNPENQRYSSPAAITKMDYLVSALIRTGVSVEIVSCSWFLGKKVCRPSTERLSECSSVKFFFSLPTHIRILRIANRALMKMQLLFFLLLRTRRDEQVLVYHSPFFTGVLKLVKWVKRIRVILQVEEIYTDVYHDQALAAQEYKVIELADKFIFSTELLDQRVNVKGLPSIIAYGSYLVHSSGSVFRERTKISVVYAGTFDERKGGAAFAVSVAEYLTENYKMHIIGFGSRVDTEELKKRIVDVQKKTKCDIVFDGEKSGEAYLRYLQTCDIGLSTQNPKDSFNTSSFPSKVLSYLGNGLRVVSIKLDVLLASDIRELITFFDEYEPEDAAKSIMSIDVQELFDGRACIEELDACFVRNLVSLLNE